MSDKKECPKCGWKINHKYSVCLHCRANLDTGKQTSNVNEKLDRVREKMRAGGKGMLKAGCAMLVLPGLILTVIAILYFMFVVIF